MKRYLAMLTVGFATKTSTLKHTRLVLAVLSLVISGVGQTEASPILVNPGFETGSLSPWVVNNGSPSVTNTQAHTGTFSVSALGNDEVRQNFAPIPTSLVNEVSFWVKRAGGTFDFVELFYSDSTSTGFTVSGSSSDWTFFNVTSHLAPGKSLTGIGVYGTSPGPAFLDDFNVDANVSPVPEPATLIAFGLMALGGAGYVRRRKVAATA